jgi:magnesium transporter
VNTNAVQPATLTLRQAIAMETPKAVELWLAPTTTAAHAVDEIRSRMSQRHRDFRVAAQVYVTDAEQHLLGVVRYRELVLGEADRQVGELSGGEVVITGALTDAEDAAHLLVDRRVSELPVVHADGRMRSHRGRRP